MMARIEALAGNEPLSRFLDLIAWSEGTSRSPVTQDDGYDVLVSGVAGPGRFEAYVDHPFADGRDPVLVRREPPLFSTAAGRYQLLLHWWQPYKAMLQLPDFGPVSQDKVALQQIRERRATGLVLAGETEEAIAACSNIWASLPGNDYGQPGGHTMAELLAQYAAMAPKGEATA